MAIEVEKKAIVTEDELEQVRAKLIEMGAEDLGPNDTESYFYLNGNFQLKIQIRKSKGDAKIAWKSGGFNGESSREEIELPFLEENGEQAHQLIDRLVPELKKVHTVQQRHDYKLGDIELALKWSKEWGYHIEFDTEVEDESQIEAALEKHNTLADKLGVHIMTEAEEKDLSDQILKTL